MLTINTSRYPVTLESRLEIVELSDDTRVVAACANSLAGKRRFIPPRAYPVIPRGHSSNMEVRVDRL